MALWRQGDIKASVPSWARNRQDKPGFKEPLALILGQPPSNGLKAVAAALATKMSRWPKVSRTWANMPRTAAPPPDQPARPTHGAPKQSSRRPSPARRPSADGN